MARQLPGEARPSGSPQSSGINSHPRYFVVFLDKRRYDNYLYFVVLNKQQINWEDIKQKT